MNCGIVRATSLTSIIKKVNQEVLHLLCLILIDTRVDDE